MDVFEEQVIDEKNVVSFITKLEKLKDIFGTSIEIKKVDISEVDNLLHGQKTINLDIEIKGSWVKVFKTLLLIENMTEEISVTSFSFSNFKESWTANLAVTGLVSEKK